MALHVSSFLFSGEAAAIFASLFFGYLIYNALSFVHMWRSPLRKLPGPPRDSLLLGNMTIVVQDLPEHSNWLEQYGPTRAYQIIFGCWRLSTLDPRAVNHILSHTDIYQKPAHLRTLLGATTGEGLLVSEGETHKRQRRIMNPSFSPGQLREVTPIFFDVGTQLKDIWSAMLNKSDDKHGMEINISHWVGRAALDIIGLSGFGYRFDALYDENNELFRAFIQTFEAQGQHSLFTFLLSRIKLLSYIPSKTSRATKKSLATMQDIGRDLVQTKKQALQQAQLEKSKIAGRDLLSSLIRANMAADVAPAHKLSDEEVIAQISTFLIAGHETSSAGLSWTLYSLAQHPEVQTKLREELTQVDLETPSMDDLNALPYLDMVITESLRIHAPVHATGRFALQDDEIPLSIPFVDRDGITRDSVTIKAGDQVAIEILSMNHWKEIWGPDADEFRPERWAEDMQAVSAFPGVFHHVMTFIGGPRACIGYRFSVIEMKALLFILIRAFEFSVVPGKEISYKSAIVSRPYVKSEPEKGLQMPLIVKRVASSV